MLRNIFFTFLMLTGNILYGQNEKIKDILNNVFEIQNVYTIYDDNVQVETLTTMLRGQWASIPLNQCYLLEFDSYTAALAFEIYLSDDQEDYKLLKDTLNHLDFPENFSFIADFNEGKTKLIQLVYYNLKNKKFIGKPDDFPLEQDFWMADTYGDIGSKCMNIDAFEVIENSGSGCYLMCSEEIGDTWDSSDLWIVKLTDTEDIMSLAYEFGSTGSVDCGISTRYQRLYEEEGVIKAEKVTNCVCEEENMCESQFNARDGENVEVEILMN